MPCCPLLRMAVMDRGEEARGCTCQRGVRQVVRRQFMAQACARFNHDADM